MKISVCILTKNSANTIEKALKSVEKFDEIIIIDDFSTDETLKIAEKFSAKIYQNKLNNDFSKQRNFGLEKSSNDWVLFLDSDEFLSKEVVKEISNLSFDKDGYYIKREEIWMGKKLKGGEWSKSKFIRLADKNKGKWNRSVHEYWDINNTSTLKYSIIHEPEKSLSDFISKINFYAQLHLEEHKIAGKKTTFVDVLLKPFFKFIDNFIFKKGFWDGVHGFVYSIFMSAHSFLVWSQLWIDTRKNQ